MLSSPQWREPAKFFTGWAASETVGHWLLGILGTNLFPINIGTFTFTSAWNTFAMIAWPIALVLLVYVGWFRTERPELHSARPTRFGPA